jgi:hypothetical protein
MFFFLVGDHFCADYDFFLTAWRPPPGCAALLIPTRSLEGPTPSACARSWGTAPGAALAGLSVPERVRSAHQCCSSVALRCRWATQFSVADCIVSSTHLALWMLGSSRPSSTSPIHVAEWSTGVLAQSLCIWGDSFPPSCLFAPIGYLISPLRLGVADRWCPA